MATFIVCPDGTAYSNDKLTAAQAGGRAIVADSDEAARLIAYADGYAQFPPMTHYDGTTEPGEWAKVRDTRILAATRRVIDRGGLQGLTRKAIADAANVKPATVSNFGRTNYKQTDKPTEGYRERILAALMADALVKGDIAMIRVGVADGCLRGEEVPEGLRAAAGV